MNYILISGILFVLSIIAFFIKNGTKQLTLRQIIGQDSYNNKRPWRFNNYPDIILMFSVVSLMIFSQLRPVVTFSIGILVIFTQKLILWIVLLVLTKSRN